MSVDLQSRAFWIAAPGRGEIRSAPLARPKSDEVLVRALCSGISRGTETIVFRGEVPQAEWSTMRCPFQQGEFPAPVKYGYASVGVVEQGPRTLQDCRVFCLHPHQDRYVVPARAVTIVPDNVPNARAVLAANMETAINGIWDAAPQIGDRISVIGAGTVGSLVAALLARLPGVEVEIVDTDRSRAELAQRLGCGFASPENASSDRDLVIHTSGSPHGLQMGLSIAGFEATVLELSWYGVSSVPLPLGEAFHSRRLQIRSSQVASVATTQRARWTRERRMALALRLLSDPAFDALLTGECSFEALPATMAWLASSPRGVLCQVVAYS